MRTAAVRKNNACVTFYLHGLAKGQLSLTRDQSKLDSGHLKLNKQSSS